MTKESKTVEQLGVSGSLIAIDLQQPPISRIAPVFSAMGMKAAGEISPLEFNSTSDGHKPYLEAIEGAFG